MPDPHEHPEMVNAPTLGNSAETHPTEPPRHRTGIPLPAKMLGQAAEVTGPAHIAAITIEACIPGTEPKSLPSGNPSDEQQAPEV